MRKYLWPTMFVTAWLFVVIASFVAKTRGFELRLLEGIWGNFIAISALTSWLGLTAVFVDPARRWLNRVFGSNLGCGLVVVLLISIGMILLIWAKNRISINLRCLPNDLELWVDNKQLDNSACHHELWVSQDATIFAYAPNCQDKRVTLANLLKTKTDTDEIVLALEKAARWSCSIHEGQVDDSEPFLGCGKGAAPWARSRTWRIEISPGYRTPADVETSRPPRLYAVLGKHEALSIQRGIALHGISDNCYAEGDDRKTPEQDAIHLSGCGIFRKSGELERYQVRLSMCVSNGTISQEHAELVKLQIGERADTRYDLECALPRSH